MLNLLKKWRCFKMKNKMLAILMAGLIVATVFGAMSASAAVISKKQEVKTVSPLGFDETGDIGAFVFNRTIVEDSSKPLCDFITDATVTCKDINGNTYDMEYVEYSPEKYFYVAYDVPTGPCDITASKHGYATKIISGEVVTDEFMAYRIEMEKGGEKHRVFLRLLDLFPNAFPVLRILLKL
jgi:hypothetical protein